MANLVVERSIWIEAPPQRVWEAITNPEELVKWFVPNLPGSVMKRDESGKVTMHMGPMSVDFMQLETTDPAHIATCRSLPDKLLTVTYTLENQKGGTQVKVRMSGFEWLPADAREDRINLSSEGWEKALSNLKASVEGHELPVPTAFVGPLFGFWREPQKKLGIERSIWIEAPREKVWRAITDPKQFQQWFSPTTEWQLSALELGGRYYVHDAESNTEKNVEIIEQLNSPHQLTTRSVPVPPDTVIKNKTYTLNEENGGTRLTVTLIGYDSDSSDGRWNLMEENAFGFGMMLQNTKAYVEGQSLPFPWGF